VKIRAIRVKKSAFHPRFIRVQSVAKKHFAIRVIEFSSVCGKLCAQ
jgi:hypothetical protein